MGGWSWDSAFPYLHCLSILNPLGWRVGWVLLLKEVLAPSEHWLFPGPYVLLEAFSTRMTFILEECFLVLVFVYAQLLTHTIVNRGLEDNEAHAVIGWKNKHPFLLEESQNVLELCLILCTSLASKERETGVKNASFSPLLKRKAK